MMADSQSTDADRGGWWQMIRSCSGTAADRRNQYRFLAWMFAWAVTFVAATWALESIDDPGGPATWVLALTPNVFSIGALLAYLRFLRMADELLRKIQIEGLAIGFGAGVIFTTGYQVLERAGAPTLELSTTIFVMMIGWVAGQLFATWRFR